jgi:hypothetical protein
MDDIAEKRDAGILVPLVVLFALVLGNGFVLLKLVPMFKIHFQDMLPGKPLPELTLFFIHYQLLLALMDISLFAVCTFCVLFRDPSAKLGIYCGIVVNLVLAPSIMLALSLPMHEPISGMSHL